MTGVLNCSILACHIGDTTYICKTCCFEFSAVISFCQSCFEEDLEHTSSHSFFRVTSRYASNQPDNIEEQGRELYNVRLIFLVNDGLPIYLNVDMLTFSYLVPRMFLYRRSRFSN